MPSDHSIYMQRCLTLAEQGLGHVAPNPLVGAVIVHNDSIIGEGFHERFGGPHAEVNAIASVKDKSLLSQSTLYVNLEPCCHQGKTPPCVDLILENKIPRVAIGCRDPFPEVGGKGLEILKKNDVEVVEGILEKESRFLNRRFITFHEKKRPYIILKWAETSDGFIAKKNYDSKWISSEESRKLVHKWRSEEMAVMVGTNTAIYDNPHLTCRYVKGKNPIRILIDREQRVPTSFHIFDESAPTILFNEVEDFEAKTASLVKIDFKKDILPPIFDFLYKSNIQSLIIEGGATLLQQIINGNYWDEARMFVARMHFEDGILAPKLGSKYLILQEYSISNDRLKVIHNTPI